MQSLLIQPIKKQQKAESRMASHPVHHLLSFEVRAAPVQKGVLLSASKFAIVLLLNLSKVQIPVA